MISYARQNTEASPDGTSPAADDHIAPAPRVSVQAFCETVETAAAVQSAGEDRRLGKAHLKIQMGGMAAAIEAYRSAPTPNVIILEAEARNDILNGLDQHATVCYAGTRVSVICRINDVMPYRELVRRGVSDYVIAPVGAIDVGAFGLQPVFGAGSQGGRPHHQQWSAPRWRVGASTVAHNVAWAIARDLALDSVVADLDLAFGTPATSITTRTRRRASRTRCSRPIASTPPSSTPAVEMHGSSQPAGGAGDARPGL